MSILTSEFPRSNPLILIDVCTEAEIKLEQLISKIDSLGGDLFSPANTIMVETRSVLDALLEGVLIVDTSGAVRSANGAFCSLVGEEERDLIGRSHWEVLGPSASVAALCVLDAKRSGRVQSRCDAAMVNASGKRLQVHITAAALQDQSGEALGSILFLYDITRQQELEDANAKLKASADLKDILLQMIVHDLRTPLTSLLTGLETAPFVTDLSDDGKLCLDIALRGGQTLLSMINDLLDVSKMEEGAMRLDKQSIDVPEMIELAINQVMPLSLTRKLVLRNAVPYDLPSICGDEEKLLRTLVNLMGNAIRFTPEGGEIQVSAHVVEADSANQHNAMLVFSVNDTGLGVSPEALPHIFEKFYGTTPGLWKEKVGSGLGLTFCKMAVEAHGGQIWVQSEKGRGSTFSFSVPIIPASDDNLNAPDCPPAWDQS
ncbi:MAG: PAS domain-containing sensor histidine kinase [Armatimonadota bacterium]|nr:PAS domain-containing sensor histidine kinase [Armatimonadota bacterium]